MKAKAQDALEPYKPAKWDQVPAGLKDADGFWTTIHSGTLGLFVNKDALGGKPVPACWKDLLKPDYKGMRGNDLQAGEAIERSLEDQVLQGDRGVERIADGVRQPAIALEALGELRHALRMDEQHRAEFLRLGPDRMKLRIVKVLAVHASADSRAALRRPAD